MSAAAMLNTANHPPPPLAVSESEIEALAGDGPRGHDRAAHRGAREDHPASVRRGRQGDDRWRIRRLRPGGRAVAEPYSGTRPVRPRRWSEDRSAGDLRPGDPRADRGHDPHPTGGGDPLEQTPPGEGRRGQPEHDPADLAGGPPQAPPDRDVQVPVSY